MNLMYKYPYYSIESFKISPVITYFFKKMTKINSRELTTRQSREKYSLGFDEDYEEIQKPAEK